MQLSLSLASAWAKHRPSDDAYLSLVSHCRDASAAADRLWTDWLPRSTRMLLEESLGSESARVLGRWFAATHDVGKLTPAFACQVLELSGRMTAAGLEMPAVVAGRKSTPHSLAGFYAIRSYLRQVCGWRERVVIDSYAVISGSHHGVPPRVEQLRMVPDPAHMGGEHWTATRYELLELMAKETGADAFLDSWSKQRLSLPHQVLWTAFTIMADWIASDDSLFELGEFRDASETAATAFSTLAFPSPWNAPPTQVAAPLLSERFGLPPTANLNVMQRSVLERVSATTEPSLTIIESAMGSGKTEAALLAAEVLAERFGCGGAFVALPTMATSNAMFSRVLEWIRALPDLDATSAILAHSKADLQDEYRGIMPDATPADIGRDEDSSAGRGGRAAEVVAHQWFFGRKKGLLANFAVGTIDQLLLAALQAKHVMLRHLGLAGKVVIVDEVHAADTYMMVYLERILEWLGAYRVPVILMSATLPPAQRAALVRAYDSGRGHQSVSESRAVSGDIGYPSVTVNGDPGEPIDVSSVASSTVRLEAIDDDTDVLIGRLQRALVDGGCVGVVCNSVGRAQELAAALRGAFGSDVVLLHSRFLAQHRADLESVLVGELGRNGDRPYRRIIVGTQVIEQSLDLDFDLLVTDVAPVDLLFQRIGRLHRHQRIRPPSFREPVAWVRGVVDWSSDVPEPVAASDHIYGRWKLLCSLALLRRRDTISLPAEIPILVAEAYGDSPEMPDSWVDTAAEARSEQELQQHKSREKARDYLLSPPKARSMVGLLQVLGGDNPDARGAARVREGDDGFEVIVTVRRDDGIHLPEQCGGELIATEHPPSPRDARRARTSSLRLPGLFTKPWAIDRTIAELEQRQYPGWIDSGPLSGELILELGPDMSATLNDQRVRYDDHDGLVIETTGSDRT